MSRTFASALRRAGRLMRPAKVKKATRATGKALAGLMVKTALAALTPKPVKPRIAKPKPTKAAPAKPKPAKVPKVGRSLGMVLAQLRAGQGAGAGEAAPRIPPGAQYIARQHRSTQGSRGYKLYLPASLSGPPEGVILMLHGCQQTPDDFALGTHMNTLAEKHRLAIAYPAQTSDHNPARCWNWFKPANQIRGSGEPALLAALARKLMREFGLARGRVFVAGLSAGGATAALLADLYPDVFAAAGIHSGLPRGAAQSTLTAIRAMRRGGTASPAATVPPGPNPVRRIIFQGRSDSTVHPSNAEALVAAALGGAAEPVRTRKGEVAGRAYVRSSYADAGGVVVLELWMIEGTGHAWSGGRAAGSYTDRQGPDASAQMVRFFLEGPG